MLPFSLLRIPALAAAVALPLLAACGSSETSEDQSQSTVVVTTNILGDVVTELIGDQVDVVTLMPVGADPHVFQASAQQVASVVDADALIVNGAGFEEGLDDVIDSAEEDGIATYAATTALSADDVDPHFFTDPVQMAAAVEGIADFLATEVSGLDVAALRQSATDYESELAGLDDDVRVLLEPIPAASRVVVTNHDVGRSFAARYDFEVVGAVIPTGSTADGTSAGQIAELVEVIDAEGVSAIFADASSSTDLAETVALEAGDVEVIVLYTESLGEAGSGAESYVAMVRTNAERIAAALS